MAISLNTILYGPPGTGKTYNVIKKAVEICDSATIKEVDATTLARYDELKKEGRIQFVTFHQSYGYEDFIEGIRPVIDKNGSELKYELRNGVFKDFCTKAATQISMGQIIIARVKDDEAEYRIKNSFLQVTEYYSNLIIEKAHLGSCILLLDKNDCKKVYAIGVLTSKYKQEGNGKKHFSTTWVDVSQDNIDCVDSGILSDKELQRIQSINYNIQFSFGNMSAIEAVLNNKAANSADLQTNSASTSAPSNKPFVFIIDEINRGNISKIFGELITLIEDDKRDGADYPMKATLPYSGEPFSVPNNVYILGTMNTADRSIALMDTALRRRFSFEEMMPDPDKLKDITVNNIDIRLLLYAINRRIEVLLDREHRIGHAYFMPLKDDPSLEKLTEIFKDRIIPLLQEYFYDDYEKIDLVLNGNGFIQKEDRTEIINRFGTKKPDDYDLPAAVYSINLEDVNEGQFFKIYEGIIYPQNDESENEQ